MTPPFRPCGTPRPRAGKEAIAVCAAGMTKPHAPRERRDAPESAEHPLRRARHALPGAFVFAFFRTAFPDACGPESSPAMPFFGLRGRTSGRAEHLFPRAAEVRMRAGQGVSFRGRPSSAPMLSQACGLERERVAVVRHDYLVPHAAFGEALFHFRS